MAHAVEVYVTMWNEGETGDKLVGAEVPFADDAVIQAQSIGDDGALEMRDLTSVGLKAGQAVTLHPQGIRLVFNDVQRVLRAGDSFHAHLEFAKAGEIEVEISVMAPDQADEMM
jgi:copper(I)-binding protein